MSKPEPEKPDMNRHEKQALEMIVVAKSKIINDGKYLKDRLKSKDKRGWAYIRQALGLLDKAQGLIYDTIPERQLAQLYAKCKSGVCTIIPNPALMPKGYAPISEGDLNVLIGSAVNNKCAICVGDGLDYTKCELRKTLMAIWPPLELPRFGGCPYQGKHWAESNYETVEANE